MNDAEKSLDEIAETITQKIQDTTVKQTIENVCDYVVEKWGLVWLSADLKHHYLKDSG